MKSARDSSLQLTETLSTKAQCACSAKGTSTEHPIKISESAVVVIIPLQNAYQQTLDLAYMGFQFDEQL
jgi:hypothetical protein